MKKFVLALLVIGAMVGGSAALAADSCCPNASCCGGQADCCQ